MDLRVYDAQGRIDWPKGQYHYSSLKISIPGSQQWFFIYAIPLFPNFIAACTPL
jgi:hypothetical protein